MGETRTDSNSLQPEERETVLRCSACGALTERLHTVRRSVRSLSLRTDVEEGDLLCERCLRALQEEFSQEELLRGPA